MQRLHPTVYLLGPAPPTQMARARAAADMYLEDEPIAVAARIAQALQTHS